MERDEKIKEIIADELVVDIEKVIPAAKLVDDLGADSLDLVELVMAFEEAFDVEISDEAAEKLDTVETCLNMADKLGIPK